MSKSWYSIKALASGDYKVAIHEEIGAWGVTAASFMREWAEIPARASVTLSIQSPGGDVSEGLAIYNTIQRHEGFVIARIEGLAASMASVIAMAADEIVMPANSYMMIHNPWTVAAGDAESLRDVADVLDRLQSSIVSIYAGRTGKADDEVRALMAKDKWMDARECLALGFCHAIEEPLAVAATFDASRFFMQAPNLSTEEEDPVIETDAPSVAPAPDETPAPDAPVESPVESEPTPADKPAPDEPVLPDTGTGSPGILDRMRATVARLLSGRAPEPPASGHDPAALVARVDSLESELATAREEIARYQGQEQEIASLLAQLEDAKSSRARDIAQAVATLGFESGKVDQLPPVGDAEPAPDIVEQFRSLRGREAAQFWAANKDALVKRLDGKS
jgi:ATP-dependent protease ClpP protease subunit